jgi:hypothetical protein
MLPISHHHHCRLKYFSIVSALKIKRIVMYQCTSHHLDMLEYAGEPFVALLDLALPRNVLSSYGWQF